MVLKLQRAEMSRSTGKAVVRLTAVALVLAGLLVSSSGSAAEDPVYPGLPRPDGTGGWVGPRATGINHVSRADQWVRLPPLIIGAFNRDAVSKSDSSCTPSSRLWPFKLTSEYHATGHFRSSKGAPEPWGYVGPFTARTVAFGNIPVEAAVEIRQPRDAENLPVGFDVRQKYGDYCGNAPKPFPDLPSVGRNNRYEAASVEGQAEIVVSALKVDGVDLRLARNCKTRDLGNIALTSRVWYNSNPENLIPGVAPIDENIMTTPYFIVENGGRLDGTVDIPPFTGCRTRAGEDVSKLLTATVSGPGNAVTMRSEGLRGDQCLLPDASTAPGASCGPLGNIDFP